MAVPGAHHRTLLIQALFPAASKVCGGALQIEAKLGQDNAGLLALISWERYLLDRSQGANCTVELNLKVARSGLSSFITHRLSV